MGAKKKNNRFWEMKMSADSKSADIFIYGEITKWAWEEYGEVSSVTFKQDLDSLGDDIETINLFINSPGGSVYETMAIIAMLERHPAEIISYIDGIAASAASILPMISKRIIMYEHSMMMIHHAWTWASGNAKQLRKAADDIERISKAMCQYYLNRGETLDESTLNEMLDEDTWLTAEQCLELGFCDEIKQSNQAVAYAFGEKFAKLYKNVPKHLMETKGSVLSANELAERQRIAEEAKANQIYYETILGGLN